MWSRERDGDVLRLTFDWDDQLRDDWQDLLTASSGQQVVNSLERSL